MAAPTENMVGVSDDSSSSDDEVLKRCKEAVWETPTAQKKDGGINVQQSKRVVVADHEHDGNELQVTQGFRTHVAKKLVHLLDSSITEMHSETLSCVESAKCDDDDEGFRLFSTSVPGQPADDPPAPVRRRPVPSSSDSDSEMETRLREAAVSVKDLLSASLLPSTFSSPSAELPCSEKIKKKREVAEEEESHVVKKKKKKKKRKQNQEGGEQVDSAGSPHNAQRNGEHGTLDEEHTQVKVKRKKKKKQRELHTEEVAVN
ncbi:protein CUSTOS [Anoplopoma fimbria]|uniref:protein CUSTOS n=1 Tax=Anoplopoma fimbria TaxID=229290 RepID=UPI0023EDBE77|nr:protein CUSTOS [Anoplopoma fimbria]